MILENNPLEKEQREIKSDAQSEAKSKMGEN